VTTVFFAGGLLFIRDGSNIQYVASSSMVLFIYTKTLNAAHIDGVKCGSVHFSASQLKQFAKSQVCTTISSSESKDKSHDDPHDQYGNYDLGRNLEGLSLVFVFFFFFRGGLA
jgi:hypothetical protein